MMLTEFIQYSTYQFFKAAKVYPLLFVEALIPKFKSNRALWEQPDERMAQARQDEQDYLDDVNYIPPTTTKESENPALQEENHNIIDDATVEYLFGAFDRREEEPPTENIDASLDSEVETSIEEVDRLLLEMGVVTH